MDVEVKTEKNQPYLKDHEVKELIKQSHDGDQSARDLIVQKNMRLVWSVVQRFLNRGYEPDDLFQIGWIGLLDDGTVKVSRSLKETGNKVRKAKDELSKNLGRIPTINELSEYLEISTEDIILAQEASRTPSSIHETVYENDGDPITLLDQIDDGNEGKWFDEIALK